MNRANQAEDPLDQEIQIRISRALKQGGTEAVRRELLKIEEEHPGTVIWDNASVKHSSHSTEPPVK